MIPEELKSGDRLEAGWLNRMVRAIVARTVNAGPGLLKTMTPAGTTLSLAPQRRAVAAADFDFPFRVTVRPSGTAGEWTVYMSTGFVYRLGNGSSDPDSVNGQGGALGTVTDTRHVILRARITPAAGGPLLDASVSLEASRPASAWNDLRIAVARVIVSNGEAAVEQYICGAVPVFLAEEEEA